MATVPRGAFSQTGEARFHLTACDNANSLQVPLNGAKVTGEITVQTIRLDDFWKQNSIPAQKAFLKIDTEGHDLEVVKGAMGVLDKIQLIMMEVPSLPRYEGESELPAMVAFMDKLGFCVCRSEKNSFNAAHGMDTALDLVFVRRELATKICLGALQLVRIKSTLLRHRLLPAHGRKPQDEEDDKGNGGGNGHDME